MKILAALLLVPVFVPVHAQKPAPIAPQSKACKALEAEIIKVGQPTSDEDFRRLGTRLPKDVYARARKNMDNGEKINAVREINKCLGTGLSDSKRIVELLP